MIEAPFATDMQASWSKDNLERALVNLERLPESGALWLELEALPVQNVLVVMANEMLESTQFSLNVELKDDHLDL